MNELGDAIREARIGIGMTLGELALAINVSYDYMSKIECGGCNFIRKNKLADIADVLALDREELSDMATRHLFFHEKNHEVALFDKIQRMRYDGDTRQW